MTQRDRALDMSRQGSLNLGIAALNRSTQRYSASAGLVTGNDDDNSSQDITASVEGEGIYEGQVAIVIVGNTGGGKGKVTGLAPGDATVRATLAGVSGEIEVTVVSP